MYNSINPGKEWQDTDGNPIQAHGGSVMYMDGEYYWYGENKEDTDGENGIWHRGVGCYRSRDLYNWENLGTIIPPAEDESSSLHPTVCMDRPHIIYNKKTNKYVCWLKIMNRDGTQSFTILTSSSFLGPYELIKENFRPFNMNCGDFDLAADDNGRAYCYFEHVHSELICAELTEDYLDVTENYSAHFPRPYPPYVREAPAHFVRGGKHWLITSGTTGYLPNPSEIVCGDTFHGPFSQPENPHPGDASNTSFHSQISCVFKVQGKRDLYIACADRWLPEHMSRRYEDYAKVFEYAFSGRRDEIKPEWIGEKIVDNTAIAKYVWLPIDFSGEYPQIKWLDNWRIDDYD